MPFSPRRDICFLPSKEQLPIIQGDRDAILARRAEETRNLMARLVAEQASNRVFYVFADGPQTRIRLTP